MQNLAVIKPTPAAALHPLIRATGVKGFLQWMKTDPVMSTVYQQISPQLNQLLGANAPGGGAVAGLGCCCFSIGCSFAPMPQVCSGALNASLSPNLNDSITTAAPTDAVNSSSLIGSIASLINTGASVALTASEISSANAVTNAQLQQAAAGRPPLNLSTTGGMVAPSSLSSMLSGNGIWILLAGAAALLFLG